MAAENALGIGRVHHGGNGDARGTVAGRAHSPDASGGRWADRGVVDGADQQGVPGDDQLLGAVPARDLRRLDELGIRRHGHKYDDHRPDHQRGILRAVAATNSAGTSCYVGPLCVDVPK